MKTIATLALRATFIASMAFILAACGGGSSNTPSTNVNGAGTGSTSAITISGVGIKGVAKFAKC